MVIFSCSKLRQGAENSAPFPFWDALKCFLVLKRLLDTPLTHLFSVTCTLLILTLLEPLAPKGFAHSLKNIGGGGASEPQIPKWNSTRRVFASLDDLDSSGQHGQARAQHRCAPACPAVNT